MSTKRLKDYAEENGITYRCAYDHYQKGLIPNAYQLPTGTILIKNFEKIIKPEHTVIYSRVSSSQNKGNLCSQAKRITDFCNAKGWGVNEDIREIGSGLNDSRPKLLKILSDKKASRLVVEHKDRLTRFGFNYIKECCEGFGCEIIVINEVDDEKEDLVQDFVSVITSFCARIYGKRMSKRKTEALIKDLQNDSQF